MIERKKIRTFRRGGIGFFLCQATYPNNFSICRGEEMQSFRLSQGNRTRSTGGYNISSRIETIQISAGSRSECQTEHENLCVRPDAPSIRFTYRIYVRASLALTRPGVYHERPRQLIYPIAPRPRPPRMPSFSHAFAQNFPHAFFFSAPAFCGGASATHAA